jgi:hypothetical protein
MTMLGFFIESSISIRMALCVLTVPFLRDDVTVVGFHTTRMVISGVKGNTLMVSRKGNGPFGIEVGFVIMKEATGQGERIVGGPSGMKTV